MSNVEKLNTGNVHIIQPNGPEPIVYAFQNHMIDAMDEFLEEHELTLVNIIGVFETIKLSLYMQNTIEYDDEFED